jgi:hypothetical protein
MATPTTKAKAPAPVPVRISDTHYRVDSFTRTLAAYDLHRNAYGSWECSCEGYAYRHTCKHERTLVAHLGQYKSVATRKGITLESLFD